MKKVCGVLLGLGFSIMLLISCSGKKEAQAPVVSDTVVAYKDTLNIVVDSEMATLYPHDSNHNPTENVLRQLYDCLVYRTLDDKEEFTSEVAKSWEYIAGDQVRFHLNDNITFSNGYKLTAEDVKFSLDQANKFPRTTIYKTLAKVEIVDPLTVDVFTFGPSPALFSNMAHPRVAIVSKQYFDEVGIDVYSRNPIGSGPYVLDEWTTGVSIDLKAREDYWRGKPATANLHYVFSPEASNRTVLMETGNADIIINPDYNALDYLEGLGFTVMAKKSNRISGVLMNLKNIPDIKVRQALAYAIDYPAVVDAVYGKMATVSDGMFPNIMPGYEKNWFYSYDPDKAKQLIAESSHPNGLEMEAMMNNVTELVQLGEILQYYWRQVGINVKMSLMTSANVSRLHNAGEFQLYPLANQFGTGDPSRATFQYDGKNPAMLNLPPEVNAQWRDYWERAAAEIDIPKRLAIYSEYQKKIVEQLVYIPIAHKMIAYVTASKVENFFPAPGGICTLWQVKVGQ